MSNQPQYNMIRRVIEPEIVPVSERHGIGQDGIIERDLDGPLSPQSRP
ncbi:hypothetical protein ACIBHX_02600 [Nonomuraea sp. NPDC050536]